MLCVDFNWEFERDMLDMKGQWPVGTCGWRHQDLKGEVWDSV